MALSMKSLRRQAVACGLSLGLAVAGLAVGELTAASFDQTGEAAWAQRSSGGRLGGGSFRSPSRSGGYGGGGYGGGYRGGYGGGGYYAPGPSPFFFLPFFFGGGGGFGSIFTVLIVVGGALYVLRAVRGGVANGSGGFGGDPDTLELYRLQVALLASAKQIQRDLNRIAEIADTSTPEGLARLNQEVTLALLRNPEFWMYAKSGQQQLPRPEAESQFNQLALAERTKYTDETLARFGDNREAIVKSFQADNPNETAEYIVITVLAAAEAGAPRIPVVRSSDELRQALTAIGSLSRDQLVALEVIWTPQAESDTLTSEELLTQYTDLVRL